MRSESERVRSGERIQWIRERERQNGEGEKSGRSDPIFRWASWVTPARPGNAGDAISDEPVG
jgi:hypothetical protein